MDTKQFVGLIDELILKDLDLSTLPEEKQESLINDIVENIQQRIFLRVLDELPIEKKEELAGKIDALQEDGQINAVLEEYLPNFDQIAKEEINGYRAIISGFTQEEK